MTLKIEHSFDPKSYRHYVNGQEFVLHCHHYMSLTTKLAEDFRDVGGHRILRETAEDTILTVLADYLAQNTVEGNDARLGVGKGYFELMGLGKLEVRGDANGGEVTLLRSHVDQGWKKKWGEHSAQVGHFNCGFAAAMFSAAFGKPARTYKATETRSIAMGDEQGVIVVAPA